MQEEKVDVQEEVVEQEEETTTQEVAEETTEEAPEAEPVEETVTIPKSKLKAMQHKAIAYDALKKGDQTPKINNNAPLADELKLIAKGLSDEEIEQAKIIAKGKELPLLEAIKDQLFVVFQNDLKEKERKEKARLGASKGSANFEPEATVKSGMSPEEHKKVWQKMMEK